MATISTTTTTKAVPHRTSTTTSNPPPSTKPQSKLKPIDDFPSKPNPYTYHLTHLSITDPNPLPPSSNLLSSDKSSTNTLLQTVSRAAAQSLITTLLTSCPIVSTPDGPSITLTPTPTPTNQAQIQNTPHPLPRRLPLPTPKVKTKWQSFAERKGIKPKTRESRMNAVYDDASGEWVKKWGYGGKGHRERDGSGRHDRGGQGEWLVELDDKMVEKEDNLKEGEGVRGIGRREKMERMRRQGRKERKNEGRKGGGGGKGKGD